MNKVVNEPKTKTATPARGCGPAAPPKLVAIAETIIERRSGEFEPASFRDRYQDGVARARRGEDEGTGDNASCSVEPPKIINVMEAL